MSGPLLIERAGPVWRLTLNRPDHGNACSRELVEALDQALIEATRAGIQALVLRGAGRHFCTGFDLAQLADETDDSLLARFVRIELMLQRLHRAPFTTIAVAHGRAMGAGADLFAACRVRIAQGDASFAFPGASGFGLVLGTRRLAQCVGPEKALAWVGSGQAVALQQAQDAGLVSAVSSGPQQTEALLADLTSAIATPALHAALAQAVSPNAAQEDASDLQALVRSAAEAGLKARIAAYIQRMARRP